MCQLLGMSSHKPAKLSFSLAGFLRRGGETDEHADGWGAAFFGGEHCRLMIDEVASAHSPLAQWLLKNPLWSRNVIAHIRKATRGDVRPENCHPFMRRLWGREWAFAHNGTVDTEGLPQPQHFLPVGDTDSEHCFCLLMDALVQRFGDHEPELDALTHCLAETASEFSRRGSFNFLLCDGERLFAHCSTELHFVRRRYPFGRARLLDCELAIEFAEHNHLDDDIVVIATRPLTDECWQRIAPGSMRVFAAGRELAAAGRQAFHTPAVIAV